MLLVSKGGGQISDNKANSSKKTFPRKRKMKSGEWLFCSENCGAVAVFFQNLAASPKEKERESFTWESGNIYRQSLVK